MHSRNKFPQESSCLYSSVSFYISSGRLPNTTIYKGADKSLARPGRKHATATEDLGFIYPIYNHNWRSIISTLYTYNKTSIKRNILTIKQNTSTSGSRSV
jgi:hypothetical protein